MENFEKNIFINCPFDEDFESLLRPLLFTIVYLGFIPRIALEDSDGSVNRSSKILKIIRESKNSIHDLSRIKSKNKNEFARLNMPFELGIDFGSKEFSGNHKDKKFLVLSEKEYDYKKALSDFSGFDAKIHQKDPIKLVIIIRDWFYDTIGITNAATGMKIWFEFQDFLLHYSMKRGSEGYRGDKELNSIYPIREYIQIIKDWKKL